GSGLIFSRGRFEKKKTRLRAIRADDRRSTYHRAIQSPPRRTVSYPIPELERFFSTRMVGPVLTISSQPRKGPKMHRTISALGGLALLLGSFTPADAGLITNGDFETGDFTGWTTVNAGAFVKGAGFDGFNPNGGTHFAALGASSLGTLSQ